MRALHRGREKKTAHVSQNRGEDVRRGVTGRVEAISAGAAARGLIGRKNRNAERELIADASTAAEARLLSRPARLHAPIVAREVMCDGLSDSKYVHCDRFILEYGNSSV